MLKDKIYNFLVRKNKNVQYEYERYVMEHIVEHYESRTKHWKILFKLNWHYRVKKISEPMLYPNTIVENDSVVEEQVEQINESLIKETPNIKENKITPPNTEVIFSFKELPNPEENETHSLKPEVKSYILGNNIVLSWNSVSNTAQYCIYKKSNDIFVPIGSTKNTKFAIYGCDKTTPLLVRAFINGIGSEYTFEDVLNVEIENTEIPTPEIKTICLSNQVILMWKFIAPLCKYNVYSYENGKYELIEQVEGQSCVINNLENNKKYYYQVRCVFDGMESILSDNDIVCCIPTEDQSTINNLTTVSAIKKELSKNLAPKKSYNCDKGAESIISKNPLPHVLIKVLLPYDTIAFDIFDTLILRPFSKPQDVFFVLEERLSIVNFRNIRVAAEKRAREIRKVLYGNDEVTIFDIWNEIEKETGLDAKTGVELEFHIEKELCFANPYMKRIFDILKALKKEIIIVSDMYFPKTYLEELLIKCGFDGFDDIFVSCNYNANKKSGELFKIVNQKIKNKKVFFLDDRLANIKGARNNGWDRFLYPNVNEMGAPYRECQKAMSEVIGSLYSGIVNAKLHCGVYKFTPQYEYGYICGGIYVLGFCNWIKQYKNTNRIDKIVFVARDGDIYKKCYEKLTPESTEYLYWSRLLAIRVTAEMNRAAFFETVLLAHINKISLENILMMCDLEEYADALCKYGLDKDSLLTNSNIQLLKQFFIDNWEQIITKYKKEINAAAEYLKNIIGDSKSIALVDVGWKGSNLLGIKWFINEKCKLNVNVHCLLAGVTTNKNQTFRLNNSLKGYMFSSFHNKDLLDFHSKENYGYNSMFFELFSQAQAPSVRAIEKNECGTIAVKFGITESENYKMHDEIQTGIMDFVTDYLQRIGEFDFLLNISGRDAYIPFKYFMNDLQFAVANLSDFRFCRELYSANKMENETIAQIMLENIRGTKK